MGEWGESEIGRHGNRETRRRGDGKTPRGGEGEKRNREDTMGRSGDAGKRTTQRNEGGKERRR
jgi:hypothetical protein